MKQEMLINVSQPEECRIAIVEDGVLEELYIERTKPTTTSATSTRAVVNLEPSIQAAFVDFGVGRNGFLHISDVEPQYFRQGGYDPDKPIEFAGRPPRRDEPHRGEERRRPKAKRQAVTEEDEDFDEDGPRRPQQQRRGPRSARGRASSRRSRIFSAAATKCWCKSSRKASAPRGRRSPPTSASPAAIWC